MERLPAWVAAAGLVLLASFTTNVAAVGSYTLHAPVACVDGVLVTSFEGDAYDPTGVTGSGTPEDPYIVSGFAFDLAAYGDHPAAVVVQGACVLEVQDSQFFGDVGYLPPCERQQELSYDGMGAVLDQGEVADFGILARDGASVLVYNTLVKSARYHGIAAYDADVTVQFSEVRVNYGGGVRVDGVGATVNVTDSYIGFNGFIMPDGREERGGMPVNAYASGFFVTDGGILELFNSTVDQNVNNIVVDQQYGMLSDTVANQNEIIRANYRYAMTTTNPSYDIMPCSSLIPPSWIWQLDDPWGPEDMGEQFALRAGASSPVASRASGQGALPDVDPFGGPDSQTDPWAIDLRLNYWGQTEGPSASMTAGEVDAKFPLPAAPPAAATAGLLREYAPQEQKVVNAVLRDAQRGDAIALLADLRALLP